MNKSLFKKYLTITMSIVLASYVVLGSVMMLFFSRYWEEEKKNLLTQNATSIAGVTGQFTSYDSKTDEYVIDATSVSPFLEILARNIDADIFITDLEGNRLMGAYCNSGIGTQSSGTGQIDSVDAEIVQKATSGFTEFRSTFGKTYDRPYYTVGIPFSVKEGSGRMVVGAVFAATSSGSIMTYQLATFQMFLIAAAATLLLTFFVVWGFTYKMVKPLRQMSNAAQAFGKGDFSVRVPANTNDEIGNLGMAFNNMANSLSNSEGMRRSFIANVSHELKTPMTTIAGFIDGILDGTIPKEKQDHYLQIVSSEIKRLSRLVKSMLALSRIDSGEMKLNPVKFDLTDTVCSTLLTFEQSIDEKKIEIRGLDDAAPLNVTGDQDLIHQVVYNLIENAVKFTNPGGYISFGLTDSIDRAYMTIENSGMGIPAEEIPMVFDRFYKTDKSRSRDKNGLGLGLYLVKTIIKLHGGDITVRSVENSFCCFEFYLPKPKENPKVIEGAIPLGSVGESVTEVQDVDPDQKP